MRLVLKRRGVAAERRFSELIRKAKPHFRLNEKDNLSGRHNVFGKYVPLFALHIAEKNGRTVPDFNGLVHAAIKRAIVEDDPDQERFLHECNRQLGLRAKRKRRKYSLWTDLSLIPSGQDSTRRFKVDGIWVFVGPRLPEKFRHAPLDDLVFRSKYDRPVVRSFAWGSCEDADEFAAGRRISEAIELLVRLLEFQYKVSARFQLLRSPVEPVCAVTSGPTFFQYCDTTNEWSSFVWMIERYDYDYWERRKQYLKDFASVDGVVRRHLRKVCSSPMENRLRKALTHFDSSWRAATPNERATHLWKVVESLFSERNQNTDTVSLIKRCSRFLEDSDEKWLVEEHLRLINEIRNSAVHADTSVQHEDPTEFSIQLINQWLINCYQNLLNLDRRVICDEARYMTFLDLNGPDRHLVAQREIVAFELKRRSL